jgi:tripartite-type tricarboxylate transporter receptor subunit TctC
VQQQASRRRLLAAAGATVAASAAASLPRSVRAQEFPDRPVKLLLGFAAGGSGDALARTIAPEVSRLLGQTLVIENRPGAATNIASEAVARATPDGYTLLMGGNFSHAVNPALFAKLPFDPQKDFTPVTRLTGADSGGQVFIVPATLPVNTMQEFIELARREGDRLNYASSGIGSPGHIAGAYFVKRTGLSIVHVPYKGASEAIRDLVAGQIQMTITAPTAALGLLKQGRVKALALTVPRRTRFLPDVPSSSEAGLADFNLDGWYGVFGPAGLPKPVTDKLFAAFKGALESPAVTERLDTQALSADVSVSPDEFQAFVRDSAARWAGIVKDAGATVN